MKLYNNKIKQFFMILLTIISPLLFLLISRLFAKQFPQSIERDLFLTTLLIVSSLCGFAFLALTYYFKISLASFTVWLGMSFVFMAATISGTSYGRCSPEPYYLEGLTQLEYDEYLRQREIDMQKHKNSFQPVKYEVKEGQYEGKLCQ